MNKKSASKSIDSLDIIIILTILITALSYYLIFYNVSAPPAEDAAMLLRYSSHLAQGNGIVWNVGEAPVDGATDFLFMILVSAISWLGTSTEFAAFLIVLFSHMITIVLIYFIIRKSVSTFRLAAVLSATYLAFGPGLNYIEGRFGTPFFALFVLLSWALLIKIHRSHFSSLNTQILFSITSLITGLIRPEGVFICSAMLLGLIYVHGWQKTRKLVFCFVIIFLVLGGAYFLWRWYYFGYPLPNPYYKKGTYLIHPLSFLYSINNVIILTLPFLIMVILGLFKKQSEKDSILTLFPIVIFTSIWILLSNEMNFHMRFQYAVMPILLISWPIIVKNYLGNLTFPQIKKIPLFFSNTIIISVLILLVIGYQYSNFGNAAEHGETPEQYDIAQAIKPYAKYNYTLAVTEAGLLPFYSNWRTIDLWGLNDQWIAHNKIVTYDYLYNNSPELIMIHAPLQVFSDEYSRDWLQMVNVVQDYAKINNYTLVAAFGSTLQSTHQYYVRPSFLHEHEITRIILQTPYPSFDSVYTTNYANTNHSRVNTKK